MNGILNKSTMLVLNRHWQAIHVKTPAEAFCMMASGAATALDISDGNFLPTMTRVAGLQGCLAFPTNARCAGQKSSRAWLKEARPFAVSVLPSRVRTADALTPPRAI